MKRPANGSLVVAVLWLGSIIITVLITIFAAASGEAAFQARAEGHMDSSAIHEGADTKRMRINEIVNGRVDAHLAAYNVRLQNIEEDIEEIKELMRERFPR